MNQGEGRPAARSWLHKWLDPRDFRAAVVLSIAAALANAVWILLDHAAPSWDQAHYLYVSWQYQQALAHSGVVDALRTVHAADPSHAPLFTVLMAPVAYVVGMSSAAGLTLNMLVAPALYLAAGEIAYVVFGRWLARLLAIFLVATMPLLVGLYHEVLQDFLLTTLTTISILLLLKSDRFRRRQASILLGIAMGCGTLTKVTFPLFVVGPMLVVVIQAVGGTWAADGNKGRRRTTAANLGLTALAYLVVILPWYASNLHPTLDYIHSTTEGELSAGAGPANPYTAHAVLSFTSGLMNVHVSWIVGLAALGAILLNLPRYVSAPRRLGASDTVLAAAFLLSWALIPYLSVALAHNQDVRLMAPALPAVAVIAAGAIAAIERARIRVALVAVTVVALAYQTVNRDTDLHPSFLPDQVSARIGSQELTIPLASQPLGYERLPERDYGTPVMDYIASVARARGAGEHGAPPATTCLLESEPVVNTNTFTFLGRSDPVAFTDVRGGPDVPSLAQSLAGCELALYVPQKRPSPANEGTRLAIVNEDFAAAFMTPRLLSIFRGPKRTFPIAPPQSGPGEERYLSGSESGEAVQVLIRDQPARRR